MRKPRHRTSTRIGPEMRANDDTELNHPVHTAEEISTIQFMGEQMGSAIAKSLLEEENARLTEETADIKRQLETRKVVERAKGILQRRQGLTEEEAYLRMRNESRRLRRPMKELAEAIILAEELGRKDPSPRETRE